MLEQFQASFTKYDKYTKSSLFAIQGLTFIIVTMTISFIFGTGSLFAIGYLTDWLNFPWWIGAMLWLIFLGGPICNLLIRFNNISDELVAKLKILLPDKLFTFLLHRLLQKLSLQKQQTSTILEASTANIVQDYRTARVEEPQGSPRYYRLLNTGQLPATTLPQIKTLEELEAEELAATELKTKATSQTS